MPEILCMISMISLLLVCGTESSDGGASDPMDRGAGETRKDADGRLNFRTLEVLKRRLNDKRAAVRQEAATALGKLLPSQPVAGALEAALNHEVDDKTRLIIAASLLLHTESDSAIQTFRAIVFDVKNANRAQAVMLLVRIRNPHIENEVRNILRALIFDSDERIAQLASSALLSEADERDLRLLRLATELRDGSRPKVDPGFGTKHK